MTYTNIAFYHFFNLAGHLPKLQKQLKALCLRHHIKGTVLLAPEGINLMVVGTSEGIEKMKTFLEQLIGKKDLEFKESYSDYMPFDRTLVKVKSQIIPVDAHDIRPSEVTAPHLSPETLKQWLDEKKDIILIDTRNNFEFQLGSFEGAINPEIRHFRSFEKKVQTFPEEWKQKTVVTFCTGGVRCEKATPIMMKNGYKNIYQLDGGILNYFQKVGGGHYKGDCFVFDKRVALNSHLEETSTVECHVCRHPVTKEEQALKSYQYEVSCPYCIDGIK